MQHTQQAHAPVWRDHVVARASRTMDDAQGAMPPIPPKQNRSNAEARAVDGPTRRPDEEEARGSRGGGRRGWRTLPRSGVSALLLAAALLCGAPRPGLAHAVSHPPGTDGDSAWTWLRRAVAPSSAVHGRDTVTMPGNAGAGAGAVAPLAAVTTTQWAQRAFAPTHKVEQRRAGDGAWAVERRLARPVPARKLSRVSVDEILDYRSARRSSDLPRMRGGGVEPTGCAAGDGSAGLLGAAASTTPLAFAQAGPVGSRGCSRFQTSGSSDWKQLVERSASAKRLDAGGDSDTQPGLFVAGSARTSPATEKRRPRRRLRPFRLSRTVEVEGGAARCPAFA